MRPRVFAAEDTCTWRVISCTCCGFNEAAGIRRGRRTGGAGSGIGASFNEAAGIRRGRPGSKSTVDITELGFNEAAGIRRGRLVLRHD